MIEDAGRKTVLVVDDRGSVLAHARDALERAGYRLLTHDRPTGSVAKIIVEEPDLVLIDVNMPGLSGDTVVRLLGSSRPGTGAVILLYSSMNPSELRARAAACNAHGFVKKGQILPTWFVPWTSG